MPGTTRNARTVLDRYFADIRAYPVLTSEEETRLARAAREGKGEAFDRLVRSNLRFVVKIAGEYRNLGLPLEDLVNEGNLGLIEAARRFDPERGIRFAGWAIWRIRKSICMALSSQAHVVRLPASQLKRIREVRTTEKTLQNSLRREPTLAEISARLPKNLAAVDPIHLHGLRVSSIDARDAEAGTKLADSLTDPSSASAEQRMIAREDTANVCEFYLELDQQQQTVIAHRFGLHGGRPLTLQETGRSMGRSHEGVRKIEIQAKQRLRRLFAARDRRPSERKTA